MYADKPWFEATLKKIIAENKRCTVREVSRLEQVRALTTTIDDFDCNEFEWSTGDKEVAARIEQLKKTPELSVTKAVIHNHKLSLLLIHQKV